MTTGFYLFALCLFIIAVVLFGTAWYCAAKGGPAIAIRGQTAWADKAMLLSVALAAIAIVAGAITGLVDLLT